MKKITLGLSLAAMAIAGAAYAEQAASGDHGNRTMTRADVQSRAAQMFEKFDANHDGKLDQADKEARRAAMFDRIDGDHNGQISRAEFLAMRPGRGHGGPDGDSHGMGRPEGGPGEGRWGGHHGGHMGGMHRGGMGGMMARMADANHDGAISQDEFVGAALQRFDRMDTNKDGTVTPDERQAARAAMRQHMHDRMGGENMGGEGMAPPPGE